MRRGQPDPPAFRRSAALADVVASPKQNGCMETHCVAGHVRLELRNVVANYPFERSHRFPVIEPNSGRRDYSRSSCDGGRRSSGRVPGSRQDACAGRNCRDFLPMSR